MEAKKNLQLEGYSNKIKQHFDEKIYFVIVETLLSPLGQIKISKILSHETV